MYTVRSPLCLVGEFHPPNGFVSVAKTGLFKNPMSCS